MGLICKNVKNRRGVQPLVVCVDAYYAHPDGHHELYSRETFLSVESARIYAQLCAGRRNKYWEFVLFSFELPPDTPTERYSTDSENVNKDKE